MEGLYSDLLKDPRWQKKRLKILERDKWKCKICLDGESTLHVHHLAYNEGDPWDAKDSELITLCEDCHEHETINVKTALWRIGAILKKSFSSDKINFFAESLENIEWFYNDDTLLKKLYDATLLKNKIGKKKRVSGK